DMVMHTGDTTTGKRLTWMRILVMLTVLLVASVGPSAAWGGRGFGGFHGGFHHGFHGGFHHGFHGGFHHGFHGGFHHGFHWFGGPRTAIGVGIGPSWGPYWGPYAYPYPYTYAYPPVVVAPSTPLSVAPSPQASWYYCDNPTGYYPYIRQCPGGWR